MSAAEHGMMRPNPALLHDLEERRQLKSQPVIAHDLGAGAKCTVCGPKCPGFQLHFWRKHCCNCRCGKADHNVHHLLNGEQEGGDQDGGFFFVGKIFDRPLRSKQEVMEFEFCNSSDDADDVTGNGDVTIDHRRRRGGGSSGNSSFDDTYSSNNNNNDQLHNPFKSKKVKFDWIPTNVSQTLARRYMKQLPESQLPIAGSQGAKERQHRLEKQFPVHDIAPDQCAGTLPQEELQGMLDFIGHVKKNVAGQATVHEIPTTTNAGGRKAVGHLPPEDDEDDLPPPPPPEMLLMPDEQIYENLQKLKTSDSTSWPPPPPPNVPKSGGVAGRGLVNTGNLYHAKPYNQDSEEPLGLPPPPPPPLPLTRPPTSTARTAANQPLVPTPSGGESFGKFCEQCNQELYNGDVAIRADRAGNGKVWHPQCFKCFTCNDLLVDLLYYHKSGRVYCARDYALLMRIPRCAACDELIFASEFTGAEDKVWHLRHFCCYECDKPLAGHKYVADDVTGQPLCLMCFQHKHGKLCHTCNQYINPEDKRLSLPMTSQMMTSVTSSSGGDGLVHWHANPTCFSCKVCRKSLINEKMTIKMGAILCSSKCVMQLQASICVTDL